MRKWYVADFETTSEETYKIEGYTRVWLWALSDMEGNILAHGETIDEFMLFITKKLKRGTIYFHNLKFDGSFILDYLFTHDVQYCEQKEKVYPSFDTLIDDMGSWFTVTYHLSKSQSFRFIDSLKVLPFTVQKIAEDFELEYKKGKIDYSDYVVNEETLEYVYNDVRIIALALSEVKAEGIDKLTTASSAYKYYESLHTEYYMPTNFPSLPLDFLQKFRSAYRGGRSQVNERYKGLILENVRRYDINSMYPYIMSELPLPYGNPIPITKIGKYKFELYHLKLQFFLKEGHIPTLLRKGGTFSRDTYYTSTEEIEEFYISNIDFQLLLKHYDITHMEVIEMYGFYTSTIMFRSYVNYWYNMKQTSKGAKRIVCKLMLNALYGKFGTNPILRHKIPKYENNLEFDLSEDEEGKHYYLPVAIAVTSWAHYLIDTAICKTGYENFVYCDTDSVHTLGELPSEMVDSKELGKFKLEAIEEKSKYVRQKTYITYEDDEWHITCAGMPQRSKDILLDKYGNEIIYYFETGLTVGGKLLPMRVKGGTVLHETEFTIK